MTLFISCHPISLKPSTFVVSSSSTSIHRTVKINQYAAPRLRHRFRLPTSCQSSPPPSHSSSSPKPTSPKTQEDPDHLLPPKSRSDAKNQWLTPKTAPSLLRNPESVFALFTLSIFASGAYLLGIARRVNATISQRVRAKLETQRLRARLKSRKTERDFLSSALEATRATLENTEAHVNAQRNRAQNAEKTLSRLEASVQDLRATEQRRDELTMELYRVDSQLQSLSEDDDNNESELKTLKAKLESELNDYRSRLKRTMELQQTEARLNSLTAQLNDKDQLERSVSSDREKALQAREEHETRARELEASVSDTLSQIEIQRCDINALADAIAETKVKIEQKVNAMRDADENQRKPQQLQETITELEQQHVAVNSLLEDMVKRESTARAERIDLESKLANTANRVEVLRAKLKEVPISKAKHSTQQIQQTQNKDEETIVPSQITSRSPSIPDIEVQNVPVVEKEDKNTEIEVKLNMPSQHVKVDASVSQDEAEAPVSSLKRQSRGRPRKTDKSKKLESTAGLDETEKPKRRRGRPRKNAVAEAVSTEESGTETPAKQKRGRPRKDSIPQTTSA